VFVSIGAVEAIGVHAFVERSRSLDAVGFRQVLQKWAAGSGEEEVKVAQVIGREAEGGVVLPALQVIDGCAQISIVIDGYAASFLGDPFGNTIGIVHHAAHQHYVGTLDGVAVFVD
jgi:hypothetical protein